MDYRRLLDQGWVSASGAGVAVWLFGIVVKFPQGLLTTDHFPRLEDFLRLCADPLTRDLTEPILAYRIAVPVLAYVFNLPPAICTYIQIPFLIAAYAVLFRVVAKRTGNPNFALLVVAGLSLTFYAHWTNRWLGYPDSFSHLCAALALWSANPLALAATCVFGALNDERWILSIPFIVYWHGSMHATPDVFDWYKAARSAIGLTAGMVCVLAVRYALTVGLIGPGIETPWLYKYYASQTLISARPFGSNWWLYALNVTMAFGCYWFAMLQGVVWQLSSRAPIGGLIVGSGLVGGVLASLEVEDVSRSVGFLALAAIIAAVHNYTLKPQATQRLWSRLLVLSSVIPTVYFTRLSGAVFIPLPFDIANELVQRVYGTDLLAMLKLRYFRLH